MKKLSQIILCAIAGFLSGIFLLPLVFGMPISDAISYAIIGAVAGAIIGCL